jgi:hypothetical protein
VDPGTVGAWSADWAWGLPLIVLTVIFHAYGLGFINKEIVSRSSEKVLADQLPSMSVLVIGVTALSAAILHALEGMIWAAAYRFLGASLDNKSAMLYSLNAITSFGHADLHLAPHWEMMGALEALNGCILFGLTTAFLFAVIRRAWPHL